MTENAPTKTHRQMVEKWKEEPEYKAAYDELEMEFTLLRELLLARQRAGMTQLSAASLMSTLFDEGIHRRIREIFRVFRDRYDHLTTGEKYDLLHLLIKKVVSYEEAETDADGNKAEKTKMDLWELPPIDPSILGSADDFAERYAWLPNPDSNQGQGG